MATSVGFRRAVVLFWALSSLTLLTSVCAPAQEEIEARVVPTGLGEMLARPLPGTIAREDADDAASLARALAGFDLIEAAQVIVSRPPDDPSPLSRHAALQLRLVQPPPGPEWASAVAAFTLRSLPGLDPLRLEIVDTSGTLLYSQGRPHWSRPPADPAPRSQAPASRLSPAVLAAAGALGLAAMLGIALRRRPLVQEESPAPPAGPLDFVADLSDDDLLRLVRGERIELIAAVAALVPAEQAQRLREIASVGELPPPRTMLSDATATLLAAALRGKLAGQ